MRPEELESELLLYWIQYRELEEKGGPEEDGDLFEEVMGREEELLQAFGLPSAQKYTEILWKLAEKKSCTPKTVQKTIEKLQQAAKLFHEKPVKPNLELLKEAQEDKPGAFNLLPELGFTTHIYTIFLYEDLLLEKKATPEAILQEMETVHRHQLYGPIAVLQQNLKLTYRRTKAYKELKTKLQFLDAFLNPEINQSAYTFLSEEKTLFNSDENPERNSEDRQPENLPPAKPYYPEYKVLLGWLEIEEIIFDESSSVTVNCIYVESYRPQRIGLGFEFEELYQLLSTYDRNQNNILNYFNKSRQRLVIDSPTVVNLKNKLGKNQPLDQHYLRVYKPQALTREGQLEEMTEEFYLVDAILDKRPYDSEQKHQIQGEINGWFGHIKAWYFLYLNAKADGLSELEARKSINLENEHIFNLSKLLYTLEKHGGKARITS